MWRRKERDREHEININKMRLSQTKKLHWVYIHTKCNHRDNGIMLNTAVLYTFEEIMPTYALCIYYICIVHIWDSLGLNWGKVTKTTKGDERVREIYWCSSADFNFENRILSYRPYELAVPYHCYQPAAKLTKWIFIIKKKTNAMRLNSKRMNVTREV